MQSEQLNIFNIFVLISLNTFMSLNKLSTSSMSENSTFPALITFVQKEILVQREPLHIYIKEFIKLSDIQIIKSSLNLARLQTRLYILIMSTYPDFIFVTATGTKQEISTEITRQSFYVVSIPTRDP